MGICEPNEDMKELAQDMNLDQLRMDMVITVKEVAKFGLDFKSNGGCKLNTSPIIYQNCKM